MAAMEDTSDGAMTAPPNIAALIAEADATLEFYQPSNIDYMGLVKELRDALEACANDSARYQWIRLRTGSVEAESWPSGVKLDQYVDAAIAQQGEP